MLNYIDPIHRASQGRSNYCFLVSLEIAQRTHGAYFSENSPVPMNYAVGGVDSLSMRRIFEHNGYEPLLEDEEEQVSADSLLLHLRAYGPIIAGIRVGVNGGAHGHSTVIFGVDAVNDKVLVRDPNVTNLDLGGASSLADAIAVDIHTFNESLNRERLGTFCLAGKRVRDYELKLHATPRYTMGNIFINNPGLGTVI